MIRNTSRLVCLELPELYLEVSFIASPQEYVAFRAVRRAIGLENSSYALINFSRAIARFTAIGTVFSINPLSLNDTV
jgi:hypothetical protein